MRAYTSDLRADADRMLADIGAPPSGTEVRHEVEGDGRVLKVWHGNGVRVLWSDGTVSAVLVPTM